MFHTLKKLKANMNKEVRNGSNIITIRNKKYIIRNEKYTGELIADQPHKVLNIPYKGIANNPMVNIK